MEHLSAYCCEAMARTYNALLVQNSRYASHLCTIYDLDMLLLASNLHYFENHYYESDRFHGGHGRTVSIPQLHRLLINGILVTPPLWTT